MNIPQENQEMPHYSINNNVNFQFDICTNDRENIAAQEDDKEKDSNQEHNNRGLTDCIEPSSD